MARGVSALSLSESGGSISAVAVQVGPAGSPELCRHPSLIVPERVARMANRSVRDSQWRAAFATVAAIALVRVDQEPAPAVGASQGMDCLSKYDVPQLQPAHRDDRVRLLPGGEFRIAGYRDRESDG